MFIQNKKIKGKSYFYLVHNVKKNGVVIKDFEKCLGTIEKVDALFQQYERLKKAEGDR